MGKANVIADILSRSWLTREQDQESEQYKIQIASIVEGEISQAQHQDQSFFNFIQASTISLSKAQVH